MPGTYTLTAFGPGPILVMTDSFVIAPPVLSLVTQPIITFPYNPLSPIIVTEMSGPVPVQGAEVTLTISSGGWICGSMLAYTNYAGTAYFNGLFALMPGTYTLTASAPGLDSVTSNSVIAPPPVLSLVTQPICTSPFYPLNPIIVTEMSGSVPVQGAQVMLTISDGNLLGNTLAYTDSTGTAYFYGLTVSMSGAYTLTASDQSPSSGPTPDPVTSNVFYIEYPVISLVTQPISPSDYNPLTTIIVTEMRGPVPVQGTEVTLTIWSGGLMPPLAMLATTDSTGTVCFTNLSVSMPGTYTLTASTPDLYSVTSNSFVVIVQDTTPPVLTVPANQIVEATSAQGATDANAFSATATDLVAADPTIDYKVGATTISNTYVFPIGTTTVSVSATDQAGNVSNKTFTVKASATPAIDFMAAQSFAVGNHPY